MIEQNITEMLNRAKELERAGQSGEAATIYQKILDIKPDHAEVLHLYSIIAGNNEDWNLATSLIQRAVAAAPNMAFLHANLGLAYRRSGQAQNAINSYMRAIELDPSENAMNGLGVAQMHLGLKEEAYSTFTRTLGISPESVAALNNLGLLEEEIRNYNKAYDFYSRAAIYQPNDIGTLNNLSRILLLMCNPGKARETVQAVLKIDPLNLQALRNLALEQSLSGDLDSSLATLRKVLSLAPQEIEVHSGLIFYMHYSPSIDSKAILDECTIWSDKFELPILSQNMPLRRDGAPNKKLRIGFVSPDLYHHPVGRSLLPLFAHHDNSQYDIYCYSNSATSDHLTFELQKHSAKWHNTRNISDLALANLIRDDQIDILIDLSLHSSNMRLLIFAHRPAPIQMTYLGYPGTTGMKSMDYRISDRFIDPENETTKLYSEETLYITSYWCYQEPDVAIPVLVSNLPALKNGFITFGCLNNISKISEPAIQCWTNLLKEIPSSKLLLYCPEGDHWDMVTEKFTSRGIDKSRIALLPKQPFAKYFEAYREIDIALDPFPFGGGITTCDALWMGVPVVSLRGKTAVGRGATSILTNIGMPGLIAHSQEEYISIAKGLCSDLERLAATRKGLREKFQQSPVMDGKRFATEMGQLFRQAWVKYCERKK